MLEHATQLKRLIRPKDLPQYVGMRPTQIRQARKSDAKFPKPIRLNQDGRAIAYIEDEVAEWQAARLAEREATQRTEEAARQADAAASESKASKRRGAKAR
jgi:predicted DNA-binding transcriptional regulator AlpA